jgi:DNA polymerase
MAHLEDARSLVRSGDYALLSALYDSVPEVLSELIRTAFVPRDGYKFIVSDFSAIEARVLSFLAGESRRLKVFAENGVHQQRSAPPCSMFREKHGRTPNPAKRQNAELALGYGGSVGALKSMGALEMGLSEEELPPLVDAWRTSNPNIVQLWWDVDNAVKTTVRQRLDTETHGIRFRYRSGMLFIVLPSGRRLCYVKPKMGTNKFGGDSVAYEGVGSTKKWGRIESYGPKFVENIVQAISRDILMYAIRTLSHCFIVGHVHDELIIECGMDVSLDAVCDQMGRTPPWIEGLHLRADGYETMFYKKD